MAKFRRLFQAGYPWCGPPAPSSLEQLGLFLPTWLIFSIAGLALAALICYVTQ
jgi:hypothetical protein